MTDADEITVPIIEITDGWTIDDLQTDGDCDDAFAVLTEAIASIEYRMEWLLDEGAKPTSKAYRKAKAALRWKKAGLQAVQNKRSKIKRDRKDQVQVSQDRQLLDEIKATAPEVFFRAVDALNAKGAGA